MRILDVQNEGDPFYTPFVEIFIKADEDDPYVVYIEASNESPDKQKDIVFAKALQDEKEHYLTKGVISWDHLHKVEKSPEFIIGEPLEVKFTENKQTFVKARLYKGVKYAESVVDLLKANCSRLGASIGGYIRNRKQLSKTLTGITKVVWDEVAITYKPVNDGTMGNVSLMPMAAFAKALMAGVGTDAANFTGGRALTKESLDGVVAELVWRMKEGDLKSEDDVRDFLDHQNVPFLYSHLKKTFVKKFSGGKTYA